MRAGGDGVVWGEEAGIGEMRNWGKIDPLLILHFLISSIPHFKLRKPVCLFVLPTRRRKQAAANILAAIALDNFIGQRH